MYMSSKVINLDDDDTFSCELHIFSSFTLHIARQLLVLYSLTGLTLLD